MDGVADSPAHTPSKTQSSSQSSHLCQACLSVLTRADLELDKIYAHHSTLADFIEANDTRCYICSWLLSSMPGPEGLLENLKLLTEGKIPDYLVREKTNTEDADTWGSSDVRTNKPRKPSGWWDCDTSWVSFTGMHIEGSSSGTHLRVWLKVNRLYEVKFPVDTRDYDKELRKLWDLVSGAISSSCCLVITQQDIIDLGLATKELPSNTGSMETWSTVEGWLQECSEQHPQCSAEASTDWYPTRLVEKTHHDTFRVVSSESDTFQKGRGYLTLSHRWGDDDFMILKTDKLSEFEKGLPIAVLRKTFQDALVIAERMKIPYVWIDSLCIIQSGDGGADWRKESTTMAEVYSNSICNISADWGDESNGLFFERTFEPPCCLQMRWKIPEYEPETEPEPGSEPDDDNSSQPDVLSPPSDGSPCYIVRRKGWVEIVTESPLNRRGWVLQERLLAPRVLHFSPKQVSWECRQRVAWERIPSNSAESPRTAPLLNELDWMIGDLRESMIKRLMPNESKGAIDWPSLVYQFTTCELTHRSDRLVAIAGIARRLRLVVMDQYVAGLWAKTLPRALTWRTRDTGWDQSRRPPTQYYAPTFSWATADSCVYIPRDPGSTNSQTLASAVFIKHRMDPIPSPAPIQKGSNCDDHIITDDVFGPITSPEVEVRLRGMLRSCRLVPQPLAANTYLYLNAHMDMVCPSTSLEDDAPRICVKNRKVLNIWFDRKVDENAKVESILYYYTIIVDGLSPSQGGMVVRGLLLKSVDASMGRFERLGFVEHVQYGGFPDLLQPLGNERDLPAWSYDETKGDHTFYIV
ncbi:hypothetical protein diail_8693 [Diaporthe ilicicola]|nr:hypothetical protein diail_8693 [Diaporthe ilicicola]